MLAGLSHNERESNIPFFYHPYIAETSYDLCAEESNHIAKTLRLNKGDRIRITDGKGLVQIGTLMSVKPQKCTLEVMDSWQHPRKEYTTHIAIAPTKQLSRLEWFVEKTTEMGIDRLSFMVCKHSERKSINLKRLEKKAISALKQSQQAWLPMLSNTVHFGEVIATHSPGLIAHTSMPTQPIREVLERGTDCLILIGPEGGFTTEEMEMAQKKGFRPVSLGATKLRTETAGIAAGYAMSLINQ